MIKKTIFRNEIKYLLLTYLLEGRVGADERLSLPEIAAAMNTSVTPVREALTQLSETGIVTYKPNRGFFVASMHDQEAMEIYELIQLLECEGLRKCYFSPDDLNELRTINEAFSKARDNLSRIQLDAQFHKALIKNFANQTTLKIIDDLRNRISIHELKFMHLLPSQKSYKMHENIINYLQKNNSEGAIEELKNNWEISIQFILQTQK